jgi:aminoglycoside 2'-N-acetyltransferase I
MTAPLVFDVSPANQLTSTQKAEIIRMCTEAYDEYFGEMFDYLPNSAHVLAYFEGELVGHAAWVTRWLQQDDGPLLRTAYVEAVATAPAHQRKGYASATMRQLHAHIAAQGFDLGGLSPFSVDYYARLGWERWRGPLAIRSETGLQPSPSDECVMILRLPKTPALNLDAQLSAEWRRGELW